MKKSLGDLLMSFYTGNVFIGTFLGYRLGKLVHKNNHDTNIFHYTLNGFLFSMFLPVISLFYLDHVCKDQTRHIKYKKRMEKLTKRF